MFWKPLPDLCIRSVGQEHIGLDGLTLNRKVRNSSESQEEAGSGEGATEGH